MERDPVLSRLIAIIQPVQWQSNKLEQCQRLAADQTILQQFVIESNYKVLLWEDSPVLFIGQNADKDWIIGTSTDEDYDDKKEYFIHVKVATDVKEAFCSRAKTLIEIWREHELCLVRKRFDSTEVIYWPVKLQEIPVEYHPTDKSFAPEEVL